MNDGSCWKLPQHAAFGDGNIKSSNSSYFFSLYAFKVRKIECSHLTQADKISESHSFISANDSGAISTERRAASVWLYLGK